MKKKAEQLTKPKIEQLSVPRRVQDIIPVQKVYRDGMFRIATKTGGKLKSFSKTYRLKDINYETSSGGVRDDLFLGYEDVLNAMDARDHGQILIVNRLGEDKGGLIETRGDEYDYLREPYNEIVKDQNSNVITQDKYMTITSCAETYEMAVKHFHRTETQLSQNLNRIDSSLTELSLQERMSIIHAFFCPDQELVFDYSQSMKHGIDFKDALCPDSIKWHPDFFEFGERFGRILFFRPSGFSSDISDSILSEICDVETEMLVTIDFDPVEKIEAIKIAKKRLQAVESNIAVWQRRQNKRGHFSAQLPYDYERERESANDFLKDLQARKQKMFRTNILICLSATSETELKEKTDAVIRAVKSNLCEVSVLRYQQLQGLSNCLPYGYARTQTQRMLTTESLAVFMPFKAQEMRHANGIYFGLNKVSKTKVYIDREMLNNGNAFLFGMSGVGKSMLAKLEMLQVALSNPNADIIIIDPEREYGELVRVLGGENIVLSSWSNTHINALDLPTGVNDKDAIKEKSQFVMSLCEQICESLSMASLSIIDRCVEAVYKQYEKPTLKEFRTLLLEQPEAGAKEIALSLELFTEGSLSVFAKETNVDTQNRIVCYDVHELGDQLRIPGMLIALDALAKRVMQNRQNGRKLYIYIDEFVPLLKHQYTASFFQNAFKRYRKAGAYCNGITQNIEEALLSPVMRFMIGNSDLIILLGQSDSDREELARLMKISDLELNYIRNTEPGEGLLKVGSHLIPFENKIPKDNLIYKMITTKPGE